jgi:acetoacetyl-CoA synthetase
MTDIRANSAALWQPSPERIADANMTRFIRFVNERCGLHIEDYPALHEFSVNRIEDFWLALWEFCGIRASGELKPVVDDVTRMPGARWFPNVKLNFAQNLIRYKDDRVAIVARDETDSRKSWTYAELHEQVLALAQTFKSLGLSPGDRVAAFMPNIGEAVIAMLAAASIGAVFSSCSPDFGVSGVLDRFGQITPKVLICSDGYRYGGKSFSSLDKMREVLPQLPSVQALLVVGYLQPEPDLSAFPQAMTWADALKPEPAHQASFQSMPFAHPLYIMFSSGTTGVPKCIVHSAGGTLMQHLKELVLHTDLKRDDHLFYYTTCGWMMWNWMVSTLAVGATLVLFDGSPSHPSPQALWDLVESERVSVFGTSAKWISASEKAGIKPVLTHKLLALRTILSTGSPLSDESFDYIYRDVKQRLLLASISGGTDIISCFALGNPLLPVYRGELQCRGLGMKVEILDDDGKAVLQQKGELACTRAFPSMPVGFWNDAQGEKYRAAYFDKFPNIWCHGDHAEITAHGGVIIYGRSDATLNPGGVRIGTAEIYRQVEKLDEVLECLAVGQDWDDDVRVILFVRLREPLLLDEALTQKIKTTIRRDTTPRHVPAKVIQVPELPRTRSGKITELAVRNVIHGLAVKNTDALANPESLVHFAKLAALKC